jgi:hypothetical protein
MPDTHTIRFVVRSPCKPLIVSAFWQADIKIASTFPVSGVPVKPNVQHFETNKPPKMFELGGLVVGVVPEGSSLGSPISVEYQRVVIIVRNR